MKLPELAKSGNLIVPYESQELISLVKETIKATSNNKKDGDNKFDISL